MAKMYTPGAKQRAAKAGWASVMKKKTARAAAKTAATTAATDAVKANQWGSLLKNVGQKGGLSAIVKKPGGLIGMMFIAQLLAGHFMNKQAGISQTGMEAEAIIEQADASPDDMYYQAMMPELAQDRRGAQDALMQAILGSRGQALQVPGERQI